MVAFWERSALTRLLDGLGLFGLDPHGSHLRIVPHGLQHANIRLRLSNLVRYLILIRNLVLVLVLILVQVCVCRCQTRRFTSLECSSLLFIEHVHATTPTGDSFEELSRDLWMLLLLLSSRRQDLRLRLPATVVDTHLLKLGPSCYSKSFLVQALVKHVFESGEVLGVNLSNLDGDIGARSGCRTRLGVFTESS